MKNSMCTLKYTSNQKIIILAFFLLVCNPIIAQTDEEIPIFIEEELDDYIEKAMLDFGIPGSAICIVKDGKVVLAKGYGVTELNKPAIVNENMLFMIGSNTKAFTATAVTMLAFEKKCSLNDRVIKWLPDFTMKDEWVEKN